MTDYVDIEKGTGELVLTLPVEIEKYRTEIQNSLSAEFAFEAITDRTIEAMNRFVAEFIALKGEHPSD